MVIPGRRHLTDHLLGRSKAQGLITGKAFGHKAQAHINSHSCSDPPEGRSKGGIRSVGNVQRLLTRYL